MAKDKDKDNQAGDDELDLASLSALVRPSEASATGEKDSDDSKLDLRALVASVPPPAPVEAEPAKAAVVEAKREEAPAKAAPAKKAASGAAKKEDKPAAVVATPAAAPSGGGSGMGIGIGLGFGLAIAAVAWFVMNGQSSTPPTVAAEGAATVALADHAPAHADRLPEAPAAVEERDHESEPAAAPVAPAPTADEVEDSADDEVETDDTAESDDDEDVEADDAAETAAAESETRHASHRRRPATTAAPAPSAPATPPPSTRVAAADPAPPPATTARRGGGLDSVLDQALGTSRTPPPSTTARTASTGRATPPSGDLPDQPSQADVRRVLASVMPQIRGCAGEQVGLAVATLMVRSDGTVASAAVAGSPFGGTPQGSCMEGALRGAHFPAFRQTTFRVQYPMSIRPAS